MIVTLPAPTYKPAPTVAVFPVMLPDVSLVFLIVTSPFSTYIAPPEYAKLLLNVTPSIATASDLLLAM